MSAALRDFDAMVMVPMYQSCIVLVGVSWGWLYYDESAGLSQTQRGLFVLGCLLTLCGILVLALRPDAPPSPPLAHAGKAPPVPLAAEAGAADARAAPDETVVMSSTAASSRSAHELLSSSRVAEASMRAQALTPGSPRAPESQKALPAVTPSRLTSPSRPPKLLSSRALAGDAAFASPVPKSPTAPPASGSFSFSRGVGGLNSAAGSRSGGDSISESRRSSDAPRPVAATASIIGSDSQRSSGDTPSRFGLKLLRAASHSLLVVAHAQAHDEDEDEEETEDAYGDGVGSATLAVAAPASDSGGAVVVAAPAALRMGGQRK